MIKIVVDAFGGDNSPSEIISGALTALSMREDIEIILTGDKTIINNYISSNTNANRITILDAPEIISNDDSPTHAIRTKLKSSIVVGLDYLKTNADAFVSAGSTGATLAGATLRLGRLENVTRPALAPLLPSIIDNKKTLLIDCGANVDCKPEMLLQFAIMGNAYMQTLGINNPKIALLNNGVEEKKGNELTKTTFSLLSNHNLNFFGNIEARDIMSGLVDIIVTDGFYGNIALKACEGTALSILKLIKQAIENGSISAKIGGLLIKNSLKSLKSKIDYTENGGALFVGVKKIVIKAHGSSKSHTICASILQAAELSKNNIINKISQALSSL